MRINICSKIVYIFHLIMNLIDQYPGIMNIHDMHLYMYLRKFHTLNFHNLRIHHNNIKLANNAFMAWRIQSKHWKTNQTRTYARSISHTQMHFTFWCGMRFGYESSHSWTLTNKSVLFIGKINSIKKYNSFKKMAALCRRHQKKMAVLSWILLKTMNPLHYVPFVRS